VSNRHVFSLLELQSDLPIIVYGSLSDKVSPNEVLDAGAKAYLEAPLDMRHLVHLVEREIAEVSGAADFV
jgi:DNA-binding response OmpR family regulator